MSVPYNHKVIEKQWQKVWDDNKAFAATDDYSKPCLLYTSFLTNLLPDLIRKALRM